MPNSNAEQDTQFTTLASETPKYRIGAVSRLTGLSADVVRVWERRYGAIRPRRSDGGSRLYSDSDIERLRRLRQASEVGHAIGQIAKLPNSELDKLSVPRQTARMMVEYQDPQDQLRENFLAAIAKMDVVAADLEISRAATLYPPRVLIKNIVSPLLQDIGDRWAHQEFGIAHEHVATNLIRNLLSSLFRLYPPETNAESIVMATPQGERHEFGLLLASLYAATRGWRVVYLGTDLPAIEIVRAVKLSRARVLALSIVNPAGGNLNQELLSLAQQVPPMTRVWLGGKEAENHRDLIERADWVLLKDLEDLDDRLKR
jgi:MerR family transcriptional regulator, light-induced transcriptional regulator